MERSGIRGLKGGGVLVLAKGDFFNCGKRKDWNGKKEGDR